MTPTLIKIKEMVQNANTDKKVLTDKILDEVMPTVQIELERFGTDFFEAMPQEYFCYAWEIVRPAVLFYLTKHHPKIWFIPFFLEKEDQQVVGLSTVQ